MSISKDKVFRRWIKGKRVEDEGSIENMIFNDYAGAQKNLNVGAALEYLSATAAAVKIEKGSQLYIFKDTAGIGYVTLGDNNAIVAGAAPAADTFPVFGQTYTLVAADGYDYIIGSANIHVYVMKDDTGYRSKP